MDCPPPLSSEDEDDDFGDFHTVFEKASAAVEGGSIKSRINLDIPVSPESGGPTDFSIDSNSTPPELPPSLPMSPETPDVDFFTLRDTPKVQNTNRKSAVVEFTNLSSEIDVEARKESAASDFIAKKEDTDLFQDKMLEIPNEENDPVVQPEDQFASFVSEDKFQSSDTDFFHFKDGGVNCGPEDEMFGVDFSDFENQACGELAGDLQQRPDNEVEMRTESEDNTASVNTFSKSIADTVAGCTKDATKIVSTTDLDTVDKLPDPNLGQIESTQEVGSVASAQEKGLETSSPLAGAEKEKSVFSWDSFEENVETLVEEGGKVNKEDQEVDNETEKFALFSDEEDEVSNLPGDQFVSFHNFEPTGAAGCETSTSSVEHHPDSDNINQTADSTNSNNSPSDESFPENFTSFDTKIHGDETGVERLGHESNEGTVSVEQDDKDDNDKDDNDKDDNEIAVRDNLPVFDAFPPTDNDDDLNDIAVSEQTPESTELADLADKVETDDFADFATGDTDNLSNKESDNDSFGNFADFGAQPDADDFSDFADFKETGDTDFGDFGDFDSKLADSSAVAAFEEDVDDDFDDFADFGSASLHDEEQVSSATTLPLGGKTEPMSLQKALGTCYGVSNEDEEKEAESVTYSDGRLFLYKVHETDAQFAVGAKWLATPSFTSQVATLCLSANSTLPPSRPTQQAVPGKLEDEFSVFGSVNTDKLTPSDLLPEELDTTTAPSPAPPGKHAAILSGYKKEQAKELSREAAAIVDSLPDLSFMLSSVLMFPVNAL